MSNPKQSEQMRDATLYAAIGAELAKHGELWRDIIALTPRELDLHKEHENEFGKLPENVLAFTAWSERRVYFPVEYDGIWAVASVPRNPTVEPTDFIGVDR